MKKVLLLALSLCLILSGCANSGGTDAENKEQQTSSGDKNQKYEVIESIEPIRGMKFLMTA